MRKLSEALCAVAVTLWVGSLWTVGALVVPTLFARLVDRMLAGTIAGELFVVVAWVSVVCGACLLLLLWFARGPAFVKSELFWLVLGMLALTLIWHFGIQPLLDRLKQAALPRDVMDSALRGRFVFWHSVAGGLYLIECLAGLRLVLRQRLR